MIENNQHHPAAHLTGFRDEPSNSMESLTPLAYAGGNEYPEDRRHGKDNNLVFGHNLDGISNNLNKTMEN